MQRVVCDASVVIPWFHSDGESEVAEARAIARAINSRLKPVAPDLLRWEAGNLLLRKKRIAPDRVQGVLTRLRVMVGGFVAPDEEVLADGISLAGSRGLSLYDASYWALARATGSVLVTLDSALLDAGAGLTPGRLCAELGLEVIGPTP